MELGDRDRRSGRRGRDDPWEYKNPFLSLKAGPKARFGCRPLRDLIRPHFRLPGTHVPGFPVLPLRGSRHRSTSVSPGLEERHSLLRDLNHFFLFQCGSAGHARCPRGRGAGDGGHGVR